MKKFFQCFIERFPIIVYYFIPSLARRKLGVSKIRLILEGSYLLFWTFRGRSSFIPISFMCCWFVLKEFGFSNMMSWLGYYFLDAALPFVCLCYYKDCWFHSCNKQQSLSNFVFICCKPYSIDIFILHVWLCKLAICQRAVSWSAWLPCNTEFNESSY